MVGGDDDRKDIQNQVTPKNAKDIIDTAIYFHKWLFFL